MSGYRKRKNCERMVFFKSMIFCSVRSSISSNRHHSSSSRYSGYPSACIQSATVPNPILHFFPVIPIPILTGPHSSNHHSPVSILLVPIDSIHILLVTIKYIFLFLNKNCEFLKRCDLNLYINVIFVYFIFSVKLYITM